MGYIYLLITFDVKINNIAMKVNKYLYNIFITTTGIWPNNIQHNTFWVSVITTEYKISHERYSN